MSEQSFLGKLQTWFKRGGNPGHDGDLPLVDSNELSHVGHPGSGGGTFLRPWAKRDQAISNLQEGLSGLAGLMNSIRDNLDRQNDRQEQLLQLLGQLPQTLETLPESSRVQSETLKAIHTQLAAQNGHQTKLHDILDRISQASTEHRRTLDALDDRLDTAGQHHAAISENLSAVGSAMQTVSRNSATSAEVLQQMKENQTSRDGELERILHRQGTRFTTMLAVAIFLSVAALAAVGVIGYLGYVALQRGH